MTGSAFNYQNPLHDICVKLKEDPVSASHLHIWMQHAHHYVVSKTQKKMSLHTLKMIR